MDNRDYSNLFTIKEASDTLGRAEYTIWWHANRNVHPIELGGRKFLTTLMLYDLINNHLRCKDGEVKEAMKKAVDKAVKEKAKKALD
jgi:hypothetical protein